MPTQIAAVYPNPAVAAAAPWYKDPWTIAGLLDILHSVGAMGDKPQTTEVKDLLLAGLAGYGLGGQQQGALKDALGREQLRAAVLEQALHTQRAMHEAELRALLAQAGIGNQARQGAPRTAVFGPSIGRYGSEPFAAPVTHPFDTLPIPARRSAVVAGFGERIYK